MLAASHAIRITRLRGLVETGPDELLIGCLQSLSRFGVVRFGGWTFDLRLFGIDWLEAQSAATTPKVSYSEAAVAVFDRAARIARVDGCSEIRVEHLLAAFADEDTPAMAILRTTFAVTSMEWRAAAAGISGTPAPVSKTLEPVETPQPGAREYLTPEEAAEALDIHVQTLRAYVRSGKLPALRLAGERSLRIRRNDLEKVLEPLHPEKEK